jgi:hypothetical protein
LIDPVIPSVVDVGLGPQHVEALAELVHFDAAARHLAQGSGDRAPPSSPAMIDRQRREHGRVVASAP